MLWLSRTKCPLQQRRDGRQPHYLKSAINNATMEKKKCVSFMLETKKVLWRRVHTTHYYLSVMFHHKNHLTCSLTREATGVRLEPGLTWPLNPAKLGANISDKKNRNLNTATVTNNEMWEKSWAFVQPSHSCLANAGYLIVYFQCSKHLKNAT